MQPDRRRRRTRRRTSHTRAVSEPEPDAARAAGAKDGGGAIVRRVARHAGGWTLGALAVAAVAFLYRKDIPAAANAIATARLGWLLALLLLALLGLAAFGLLFRSGQTAAGAHVALWEGIELGNAAYALNLVVKSSGLAGVVVFTRRARARGEPHGRAVAGYLLATVLNHFAFAAVLLAALATLLLAGRFTAIDAAASAVFGVYLGFHIVLIVAAARSRSLVRAVYAAPRRALDRLRRALRLARRPVREPSAHADELFDAIALIRTRPLRSLPVAGWAISVDLVHVLWVYAAVQAVGGGAGLDAALVAYGVATLFGIVGIVPGGLGFVELGMTAALVSYGMPTPAAAAATVLYRVAELWLPLAAGALASRRLRRPVPVRA